jgi:hypothetical protein
MHCSIDLRNGIVYIPTMGKMGEGFYRGIEPVAVVAVQDTDALREALIATITRGNPDVPMLKRRDWPPPVTLKYAKVKTWSAFERGLQLWGLEEKNAVFVIDTYSKSPNRMWVKIPEKRISFPVATPVNEVIDRMIAILQEAA